MKTIKTSKQIVKSDKVKLPKLSALKQINAALDNLKRGIFLF